jgi:hypothetical protein
MTDTELDELLGKWNAPATPASLRARVKLAFSARRERRTFFGWRPFAVASLGVGLLVLAMTQAFPQTRKETPPAAQIPYTVESETYRYAEDGSVVEKVLLTSYSDQGREIVLDKSFVGHPFETFQWKLGELHNQLALPLFYSKDELARFKSKAVVSLGFYQWYPGMKAAELTKARCVQGGAVVAREPILSFLAVAIRPEMQDHQRTTVWMAPDLGCFALKATVEEQRPDGTFHKVSEKRALKVTWNAKR